MAARSPGRYGQDVDKPKPHNDVYTGLLAISLVGMLIGSLLLFLDWQQYPEVKPQPPPLTDVPGVKKAAPPKDIGVAPAKDAGKEK